MLKINSRITGLIEKLEAGEPVSQMDVDRACQLQALDLAKAGEDFVNEACQRDFDQLELLRNI